MLNLHCNNNNDKKKPKKAKKLCVQLDGNRHCSKGCMDLKSTVFTTRLRSSMPKNDKKICCMQ